MAEWTPIPLATKTSKSRSPGASSEELTNLYVSENPDGAAQAFTLYGTPGKKRFVTIDASKPTRGLLRLNDLMLAVIGGKLYSVTLGGLVTELGAIEGTRAVRMVEAADNRAIIVSDNKAYVPDLGAGVVLEASRGDFLAAAYQDGYGIYPERLTQNFYISLPDQPQTIQPLDFDNADAQGDINVGGISVNHEYWHFKRKTIEVYADTGAAAFPFERQRVISRGCSAVGSIAASGEQLLWQGDDRRIYGAGGYTPQRLSTESVEAAIDAQSSITDAEAFVYSQGGRTFYQISHPGVTNVFDIATGRWSRRTTRNLPRDRAHGCAYFENAGKTYVGDYLRGIIYELDLETYTDDGDPIERVATCPKLDGNGRRLHMGEVYLDILAGVGTLTEDRLAYLQWSDDDGRTWCDPQPASIGKLGQYGVRATWRRLGSFYKRILRFRVLDPCFVAIQSAAARLEQGQ